MKRILVLAISMAVAVPALTQPIPQTINYQGRLTDNSPQQNPITGTYNISFEIWTSQLGGSIEWSEGPISVNVVNGIFNVVLGSHGSPIPRSIFTGTRYLSITVGTETLSPRQELTSSGVAHVAELSDDANSLGGVAAAGWQQRVVGTCPAGSSIATIYSDGTVACEVDDVGGITSETDPQVGALSTNRVPRWSGSELVDGKLYDNGTDLYYSGTSQIGLEVRNDSGLSSAAAIAAYADHTSTDNYAIYAKTSSPNGVAVYADGGSHTSGAHTVNGTSTVTGTATVNGTSVVTGQLGINQASPTSVLDVWGTNMRVWKPGTTYGWGFKLNFGDAERVYLHEDADDDLTIKADRLALMAPVGVGTTTPGQMLTVAGTIESTSGGIKFPDGTTQTSALPSGVVVLWSGAIANIPTGWALCDGTNGTPNLRNQFVVGAGGAYSPGDNGGSTHHGHTVDIDKFDTGQRLGTSFVLTEMLNKGTDYYLDHRHEVDPPATLTDNVSNLPPYYALAYIMKL